MARGQLASPDPSAATATSPASPTTVETATDEAISPSTPRTDTREPYQATTSSRAAESTRPAVVVAPRAAALATTGPPRPPWAMSAAKVDAATAVPAATSAVLNPALSALCRR